MVKQQTVSPSPPTCGISPAAKKPELSTCPQQFSIVKAPKIEEIGVSISSV